MVHGFFTDGSFVRHPETGKTYDFVSMKRSWKTDAPEREIRAFTKNALKWLAQEFWGLEEELEDLHSKVLEGEEDVGPRTSAYGPRVLSHRFYRVDSTCWSSYGLRAPFEYLPTTAKP